MEEKKISDALLVYSQSNQMLQNLERQHEQLVNYKKEYYHRIHNENTVMLAQTLTSHYQFIDKLTLAIKEQTGKIFLTEKKSSELFKKYIAVKQKSEGFEKLLASEIEKEGNAQRKVEQKQYDESASNQWHVRRDERK